MTNLHVIVGAGATGSATARLLAAQGQSVRILSRSGSGPTLAGVERARVDASDAAALTDAATGAAVIYNCANPAYHRWQSDWPPIADALLAAAEAHDAVLVTLSNLYAYAPGSTPMRATDPLDPPTANGEVRAAMWEQALAAHQAGRVRVTEARASDFLGPGLGDTGHMGDRVIDRIRKGKSVQVIGDPDQPHSWTAIDDVARTLVALGEDERAWGRAWHVPTAPPMTQRDVVHAMCDAAGSDRVKVGSLPDMVLRVAGVFVPAMRIVRQMSYQFTAPFVIDATETTAVFGITPTSIAETIAAAVGESELAAA